ncbi:DNA polymerase III subunit gamma/tau [Commensalibacter sp. M0357]|uniref:DNA polymerase III subunit gamma/tau n=1 Tax=unclassified Commensalibacter TaxID=2630218 RepID=UPI0018DE2B89|nr:MULTISPECIES: DNA polymerase III subunit gamma/tau [unclassified Commensalibacter]MBI0075028.1 DNA polymerase III subunit gamma/tau [Commensalibacter sp. M0357]MBI0084870.1 DNA polymerase III subunit gamma/tau [Commensalibacter sp. M0355]
MKDIPDEQLPTPDIESAGLFESLSSDDSEIKPSSDEKSYRVLARKYRPQDFKDLIGQETMVQTLRNAFAMGRVAHAFMLTGVRGVGKTTTARIIARALNCIGVDGQGGPTADPCGVCPNCKAILADRHPDVLEIDAASHTGVDDVREIIDGSRFRPIQARMKVYIIDEVHMLSRNAFNALLKTLEEPPDQVTFIFATTEIRKVPVTVLSRCQRFDLRRVPQDQLSQFFQKISNREKVNISDEAIHLIARAADGSVRDGLSLLDQAIALGRATIPDQPENDKLDHEITAEAVSGMLGFADKTLIFDLLEAIMSGKADQVLSLTEQAYAGGIDLGVLLSDLLELIHLISRMKSLPNLQNSSELSELERNRGGHLASTLSIPLLGRAWQMLLKGIKEVDMAPNRKAAAEMILIRLCFIADLPTPGEIINHLSNSPEQKLDQYSHHSSLSSSYMQSSKPTSLVSVTKGGSNFHGYDKAYAINPLIQPKTEVLSLPKQNPEIENPRILWNSWREIISFVKQQQAAILHAHLRNAVHLVKFAPPMIEIRIEDRAPANLPQQLSRLLNEHSGLRWTIVLSQQKGEPTLMEQESLQAQADFDEVASEPIVKEIMRIFPGAVVNKVINPHLDEYGLFPEHNSFTDRDEQSMSDLETEKKSAMIDDIDELTYN